MTEPNPLPLSQPPQGDSYSGGARRIHCHAKSAQGWGFHNGRYLADRRPDMICEQTSDKAQWHTRAPVQPLTPSVLLCNYKQTCRNTHRAPLGHENKQKCLCTIANAVKLLSAQKYVQEKSFWPELFWKLRDQIYFAMLVWISAEDCEHALLIKLTCFCQDWHPSDYLEAEKNEKGKTNHCWWGHLWQ